MTMNIQWLNPNDITPYDNNPRKNEPAVSHVVESISRFGFQQPIVVDKNNVIIVGHTRYKAAKKIGLKTVPVLVAADLSEDQVRAYRLADNKTSEYAKWDDLQLSEEFRDLLENNNLSNTSLMTAFSELEIDRLLNGNTYNADVAEIAKNRNNSLITKRVGLLVLKNSYVNRGVATYVNGWLEWGLRNNVQVDVISDATELRNNQFDRYESVSRWISPNKYYTDDDLQPQEALEAGDTNAFEHYEDTHSWIGPDSYANVDDTRITMRSPIIRLQDSVDLRSGLVEALTKHSYDALILNTVDTLFTVVSMGLHTIHDNIYYVTHSPVTDMGMGGNNYQTSLTQSLLKETGIKIICQSDWIADVYKSLKLTPDDRVFPFIPMLGQPELLNFPSAEQRKGILFIGPYESRKAPEVFIDACKQSGKPALLITPSQKSADKFKKRFLQEGIEHEIHVALSGNSKVEVMKRAALCIIPSEIETFCFTAFEAAHTCRTIIPAERDWTQAHKDWCILEHSDSIASIVNQHYGQPITDQSKLALLKAFNHTDEAALKLLNQPKTNHKVNDALSKWLDQRGSTSISEFFNSRPSKVLDEMFYVIRLLNHCDYEFEHTMTTTLIHYTKFQQSIDINQQVVLEDINV
jgi:ParB family chromosome partitioning protein